MDTIVIKAPAGTKAGWVRESQRAGLKLSDWVRLQVSLAAPAAPCKLCDCTESLPTEGIQQQRGAWKCAHCGLIP